MEQLVTTFTSACEAMLSSKDPERQREADKWIIEFQKKPEAWAVVDTILSQPDEVVSVEVQFLAAKTFHSKLKYDFMDQVARSSRAELREKLLQHLTRHFGDRKRKRVVTTQLALALAALAIQMEEWENPIMDLASRLGSQGGTDGTAVPESSLCLIEILQVIPEELQARVFLISPERSSGLNMEMYGCSTAVLQFLTSCAASAMNDPFVEMKILDCLQVWISKVEIPGEVLASSNLVNRAFQIIEEGTELLDSAARVIVEMLYMYTDFRSDGAVAVMSTIAPKIFALAQLYSRAAQEDDDEMCTNLVKIFSHTARAYLPEILKRPPGGAEDQEIEKLLQLALAGPRHSSMEVAMDSWYSWEKVIRCMNRRHGNEGTEFEVRRTLLTPYIHELVQCGFRHLELPDDFPNATQATSRDFNDEIIANREDIEALIDHCDSLLGHSVVLTLIKSQLDQALDALRNQQGRSWQRIEALVNAAVPIAHRFTMASSDSAAPVVLDYIVQVCLNVPTESVLLRETICCFFGRYAHFLQYNPQKIEAVINFELETIMNMPNLSKTVAEAVRHIADVCCGELMFAALKLFNVAFTSDVDIPNVYRLDLLEAVALIIQHKPYEETLEAMKHVTGPAIQLLRYNAAIIEAQRNQQAGTAQLNESDIALAVNTIELFIRFGWRGDNSNRNQHPGAVIFAEAWPSLRVITEGMCKSNKVVECLSGLYKWCIREFEDDFKPYLADFMTLMVRCFQESALSPFIYAAGIATARFGSKDRSHINDYLAVLAELTRIVFQILTNQEALDANPDIVEDFFITMDRNVGAMPEEVIQSSFFPSVFACGAAGVLTPHREAARSLLLFLDVAIDHAVPNPKYPDLCEHVLPVIRSCFAEHGQTLVNHLVAGIAGASPVSMIDSSSEGSLASTLYTVAQFLKYLPDADSDAFANSISHALRENCPHVSSDLATQCVRDLKESTRDFLEFRGILDEFSRSARMRLKRTVAQ
mmetsp:Transcript_807/g.1857  ORF Transcript_807/g.1857 Transcript_807/m.1857 type:complete len:988 (+) Transcript_807:135-3098(+)